MAGSRPLSTLEATAIEAASSSSRQLEEGQKDTVIYAYADDTKDDCHDDLDEKNDHLQREQSATAAAEVPPATTKQISIQDQTNLLPAKQVIVVFIGLTLPTMLLFLDQTIVSTALPSISKAFNAGSESIWVGSAYLLTSTAFQPSTGRLSDIFGRKVMLLACIIIFLIASLACALAQTMLQLIIFRAFQGVGGGALITLVLIIMSDVVSLKDRGKYQGILEAVIAISNGIGPLLGGVFTSKLNWRWCFWINLPLGAVSLVLIVFLLPLRRVKGEVLQKVKQVDWVGTTLTLIASILVLLALNWGGVEYSWSSAPVLSSLIIGIVGFVVFWLWEWRFAALPIVPMSMFRIKTVTGVLICTLSNGMVFFQTIYFVPQLFQLSFDYSPIKSGALILPFLVIITVTVFTGGQCASRWGFYRPFIFCGFAGWSIGNGLLSTVTPSTSQGTIIGFLFLCGLSAGGTFQTSLLAAQSAVPRKDMAVVTSVRNFVRSIGATLGLSVAGGILNNTLRSAANRIGLSHEELQAILDDPLAIRGGNENIVLSDEEISVMLEGYTEGFRRIFLVCAGLSAAAFISAVLLIQHHDLHRKEDEQLKAQSKAWLESKKAKRPKEGDRGTGNDDEIPAEKQ
ncbi:MFS general substrate transporter [Atractiella rhizophila]|nr:MFS general substrate transporter [Atractiella rhizophila]